MPENAFLGRGWGFPPEFDRQATEKPGDRAASTCRGQVSMVEGEEDICQSLKILFNTALGERVMQPRYGCDLNRYVMDPMNAAVLTFIEDLLRTAIIYHEPRIEAERLEVTPQQNIGELKIELDYVIRATNSRFNFVYPFYANETGQEA